MAESSKLKLEDDTVARADKQAKILHRFSVIAERIRPRLQIDGSNFNVWLRNMIHAWTTCFIGDEEYFNINEKDKDYRRNLVALSFIRNSVERQLFDSISSRLIMPNARTVYQALKNRFGKSSWSSIIHHAETIFNPTDQSGNIVQHAIALGEAVEAIENQIGALDSNKIITLSIFFSVPHLGEQIMAALDNRLAANPSMMIQSEDILDMVRQMSHSFPKSSIDSSLHLSKMDASNRNAERHKQKHRESTPQRPTGSSNRGTPKSFSPVSERSPEWRKKWLNVDHPCFHCGEAGHWAPDCPTREKAAKARSKNTQCGISVAEIGVVPMLEQNEVLLDSGATHSVVGDISLFTKFQRADMNLSVASQQSYPVVAIGQIVLKLENGSLIVDNVLYCKQIPGIVLSIGQLMCQGIGVELKQGIFVIRQNQNIFYSYLSNFRWFLRIMAPSDISASPILANVRAPPVNLHTRSVLNIDYNLLWHQRMGHLSARSIKRLLQFKAASGIPSCIIDNIGICHPCSVAKSQHRPIQGPSRKMVQSPGDVIIADLIGPLPISLDCKKYVLNIQDYFSRLTVAFLLMDKAEAKGQLQNWMTKFANFSGYTIKVVRTDNGSEFKNWIFDEFLRKNGIIHEFSVPYEHHQNGKIEQTNRTLSEISRTILVAANLPVILWPWAFCHAVWIFSRTLHAESIRTPYEIISKRIPSMDMLRIFGSKAYIHDHNFRKDMSGRAIIGYHVGIAQDSRGWLFWIPDKKQIVKLASVRFDETTMFQGNQPEIETIQVKDLFDGAMISEIEKQEQLVHCLNSKNDMPDILPSSYKEAMQSDESNDWSNAIDEELRSMEEEKVFEITDLSRALREVPHESICSTKWVFVKKQKPQRFKARLVARGFCQIHGINYEETFAPTPTFSTLRLLFLTACINRWEIRTFDMKVAFLHSFIDKPVYIWAPQSMSLLKYSVLKLKKALYGTKQAARCWWLHLKKILLSIGFISGGEDPSTYTYSSDRGRAILWIHVDDGALMASSSELLEWISSKMDQNLKIKWDTEVSSLVGISINHSDAGFKFSQPELIDKIISLKKSNVTARSPLPANCNLVSNTSSGMDKEYLRQIGMILYVSQGSRPDVAYAVNYLARFSMGTDRTHWDALEHLIAYLHYTRLSGILISAKESSKELKCYVDANRGGEAEYMAISFAAKECLWMSNLFCNITGDLVPQILSDNKTAIGISTDSMNRKQTRHLWREFNLINEYIVKKKLILSWISTKVQLADIMTKALGHVNVKRFTDIVNCD
ncbi:hypothetical protein O181_042846 [Austropuccinia psidii MF-1]|uniref:Gag-Pol-p199 n=1 Tax=Austropuccinia psidii MF-1 TaxID=1389203 RepID=A0A9Q3DFL3_9BASI|nr:hypothetical protein [Austropuccinia psidii MF-1]